MTRPADAVVSAVAPALDDLSTLRKARALIEKPEHWTKFTTARGADRQVVGAYSDEAISFCAIGAVMRAARDGDGDGGISAEDALRTAMHGDSIACFNDAPGRTHAEVLAAFDKAIASLEAA